MTMATLICFSCCFEDQPQPKTRRPRLDPTMIGMPTNFRHTAHIGSGDVSNNTRVTNLENQMSSKGGYDQVSPVNIELKVIDLPGRNQT